MEFKTIACVGAGIIGQSWATLFASNGLQVNLQDITQNILEKAHERIASNLFFLEQNNIIMKGEITAPLWDQKKSDKLQGVWGTESPKKNSKKIDNFTHRFP